MDSGDENEDEDEDEAVVGCVMCDGCNGRGSVSYIRVNNNRGSTVESLEIGIGRRNGNKDRIPSSRYHET